MKYLISTVVTLAGALSVGAFIGVVGILVVLLSPLVSVLLWFFEKKKNIKESKLLIEKTEKIFSPSLDELTYFFIESDNVEPNEILKEG
jgi:hypothetical protein